MRILAAIGVIGILAIIAGFVFLFAGFYDVAATAQDAGPVDWFVVHVREASINRRASDAPPGSLDDVATIRAGAKTFASLGCANCHGGPGVKWAKFSEGLNPSPPDLKDVVQHTDPANLFWVVKHGIKMTGMPSFAAAGASDEQIWSVVAFLRKLPIVSDDDYKTWTSSP